MRVTRRGGEMSPYLTWYEFKKDLEKQIGHSLTNWNWFEVKPKAPLPWDIHHMKAALSLMTRSQRQKCYSKQCGK